MLKEIQNRRNLSQQLFDKEYKNPNSTELVFDEQTIQKAVEEGKIIEFSEQQLNQFTDTLNKAEHTGFLGELKVESNLIEKAKQDLSSLVKANKKLSDGSIVQIWIKSKF